MAFLPYENYYLETRLSEEEIINRLSGNIAPKKTLRSSLFGINPTQQPYEGILNGNSFKINRIIRYRNSFLPVIFGTITPMVNGCRIHVRMRLISFVIGFGIFWFGGVLFATIMIAYAAFSDRWESNTGFVALIPLFMLVFGYLLFTGGFKYESSKSKKFLTEILEAEELQ